MKQYMYSPVPANPEDLKVYLWLIGFYLLFLIGVYTWGAVSNRDSE